MTARRSLSARERVRLKLEMGWRVSCDQCGTIFETAYRMNATRAERAKYCSRACYWTARRASAKPADHRFWQLVDRRGPDECWPWRGHRRQLGYGWFNLNGRPTNASRAAYILLHGPLASDQFVCHSCDNPPCCNPAHLWLGTAAENNRDRELKGRGRRGVPPKGEAHPSARLSRAQALEAYHSSLPAATLAARWGVTSAAIYNIRAGKSWAHATGARR